MVTFVCMGIREPFLWYHCSKVGRPGACHYPLICGEVLNSARIYFASISRLCSHPVTAFMRVVGLAG